MKGVLNKIKESIILPMLVTLVICLFILSSISLTRLRGDSMQPTESSFSLGICIKRDIITIKRGDYICTQNIKTLNKSIGKRVIGIPGDTVVIAKNGAIFINGERLIEPYISTERYNKLYCKRFVLKENQYILLGDNRPNSYDSRSLGVFYKDEIDRKVIFTIDLTTPFFSEGEN